MQERLQNLRDEAKQRSRKNTEQKDKDSADAWERISLRLDNLLDASKNDFEILHSKINFMQEELLRIIFGDSA